MRLVAAVGLVAAVLLTGCDSERRAIDRTDLPAVDDDPTPVSLGDEAVEPSEVELEAGSSIVVVNDADGERALRFADDLTTGTMLPGEEVVIRFDEPGTYEGVTVPTGATVVVEVAAVSDAGS